MPAGRPSIYTDELAEVICDRIAAGESLVQICAGKGMPGMTTVLEWAQKNEEFRRKYVRAREAQAEVMDNKIMVAASEAYDNPQAARVQIEAYKWRAAKLAPKVYGDKVQQEVSGSLVTEIRRVIVDPNDKP